MILGQLNVLNATVPSKKISTASFFRYGLLTGSTPYPGDKLLSSKWLIWGHLNVLNATAPSKNFVPCSFWGMGYWLGAPPTPGRWSNKWLILANLTLGNATPPSKKCLPCRFWDTAFDLEYPLCRGYIFFVKKTTDFGRFEGVECIPALHSLYDIGNSWDNIIPRLKLGDNQIWPNESMSGLALIWQLYITFFFLPGRHCVIDSSKYDTAFKMTYSLALKKVFLTR